MIDVLILFESRSRELENCALLATELELRGYKTMIKSTYSPFKYFVKPKVLVVPHLYNDQQLVGFAKNMWLSNKKIVDLQYEQILGTCIKEDDIHNPKGQAKLAHHVAWGEDQAKRYRSVGIPESNIHITGSMSMDLMREKFANYFLSKEEIANKCQIDASKEWILFVSSFAYANRTEEEIHRYEQMNPTARLFSKISDDTFTQMIEWLKKATEKYSDKEFIYRPHPAEKISCKVYEIEKLYSNFHVVEESSMRQWARVADKIYNWYSTSIADIFFAHKCCYILRPVKIPENLEVSILEGAKYITEYEEFERSIAYSAFHFPISSDRMEYYYGKADAPMAYQQIADLCKKFIDETYEGVDYNYGNYSRFNMRNIDNMLRASLYWMNIPFYLFCKTFKVKKVFFPFQRKQHVVSLFVKDIYGIGKDLIIYKKRLRPVLKKLCQG